MTWTEIGSVASESSKNTRYAISVNTEGDLGCKCMSYAHSKEVPKVCKHVQSPEAGRLLRAYQLRFPVERPLTVQMTDRQWRSSLYGGPTVRVREDQLASLLNIAQQSRQLLQKGYGIVTRGALDESLRAFYRLA